MGEDWIMPFNTPSNRKEVSDRMKTDVQGELPQSNPFLKNSFLSAIITGLAGRVFDFFLQLNVLTKQMFPDTATGTFLERWASYKGVTRSRLEMLSQMDRLWQQPMECNT
jgi:uncharacterized phage protein gp47/JayE